VSRVLVVRSDNDGDVLLAGPAVRAAAAATGPVTLLCGPRGRQAADLLPGVGTVLEWRAPWIDPEPEPVRRDDAERLVAMVRAAGVGTALVLTSYHQSPLPMALLLRLAGVPRIAAISEDYPGSLLDVRHRVEPGVPEAERALSLAAAAGYALPAGDDGRLAVRRPLPDVTTGAPRQPRGRGGPGGPGGPGGDEGPYVVVHPGASAPARAWPPERCAEGVRALVGAGHRVVVTGSPGERALTARVAGPPHPRVTDLGGRTTLAELAAVLAGAQAVVVGNTGPAHLAAAVGTPVVSLFAPTVPYGQWGPYRVPAVRLGDADAPCAGSRARICPVPGHPCLTSVRGEHVVAAVARLVRPAGQRAGRTAGGRADRGSEVAV